MKIGLLTITPTHNYGGILQATALYAYLQSLGHDVVLIDYKVTRPLWKRVMLTLTENTPFQNIMNKRGQKLKAIQLAPFIQKQLPTVSEAVYCSGDLKLLVEKNRLDGIVVGSDQVWRHQYIKHGDYSVYFLNFTAPFPFKKIAYAASFGTDCWEAPSEVNRITALLSEFNAVSLREKSGIQICKEAFNFTRGQYVLDPTMLVGQTFYNAFLLDELNSGSATEQNAPIVTYFLDDNQTKNQIVHAVAKSQVIHANRPPTVHLAQAQAGRFFSVEEWLSHIKHAHFVITDSFHGMLFSILFKKQFLVIGNSARGLTRFTSFLSMVGLEDRLILPEQNREIEPLIHAQIEYKEVTLAVEKLRAASKQFLLDALNSDHT